jgi:hypothetical protein
MCKLTKQRLWKGDVSLDIWLEYLGAYAGNFFLAKARVEMALPNLTRQTLPKQAKQGKIVKRTKHAPYGVVFKPHTTFKDEPM